MGAFVLQAWMKKNQTAFLVALGVLAIVSLLFRVLGVFPSILPDEFQYSNQVRHQAFSEHSIPNYLYSLVYSSTNLCGPGFYACAKALNLTFLAGFAFMVYLIATRFASRGTAAFVAIVSVAGSIGAYASFFMPESMYYFGTLVLVYQLLKLDGSSRWLSWVFIGGLIALVALTKPHGLFLLPAAVIYALYLGSAIEVGRAKRTLVNVASLVASAIGTKLLVGLILAGSSGLTLLGDAYQNSFSSFVNSELKTLESPKAFGEVVKTASVVDVHLLRAPALTLSNQVQPAASTDFFTGFLSQFGGQLLAVILVAGLGFIVLSRSTLGALADVKAIKQPSSESKLAVITSSILFVYLAFISVFAVLIIKSGGAGFFHLFLRYYEFLIPLLFVVVLAESRSKTGGQRIRVVWAVVFGTAMVVFAAVKLAPFTVAYWDSVVLAGFTESTLGFVLLVATSIGAIGIWAVKPSLGARAFTFVFVPLFTLIGCFNLAGDLSVRMTPDAYDKAAIFAKDYLPQAELSHLTVVGADGRWARQAIMQMDAPGIDYLAGPDGTPFDFTQLAKGKTWVLAVGDVVFKTAPTYQIPGTGYVLARVAPGREFNFNQTTGSGMVESTSGLGFPEHDGAWTTSTETTITLDRPLPANAQVSLGAFASAANSGKDVFAHVGESVVRFQVGAEAKNLVLHFTNSKPVASLKLTIPNAVSPKSLGTGVDERNLGLKLLYIVVDASITVN
jgi:phosphoglycerol transferase